MRPAGTFILSFLPEVVPTCFLQSLELWIVFAMLLMVQSQCQNSIGSGLGDSNVTNLAIMKGNMTARGPRLGIGSGGSDCSRTWEVACLEPGVDQWSSQCDWFIGCRNRISVYIYKHFRAASKF